MNDHKRVWIRAYHEARDSGLGEEAAIKHAEAKAQEWTEQQITSAETRLEDR